MGIHGGYPYGMFPSRYPRHESSEDRTHTHFFDVKSGDLPNKDVLGWGFHGRQPSSVLYLEMGGLENVGHMMFGYKTEVPGGSSIALFSLNSTVSELSTKNRNRDHPVYRVVVHTDFHE